MESRKSFGLIDLLLIIATGWSQISEGNGIGINSSCCSVLKNRFYPLRIRMVNGNGNRGALL